MATVNILLPAFGITWAQDGIVEAIDEAQWRAGWAFIGATPPSVEQFNKVHQIQDEKANWLYRQMLSVFTAAGITPTSGNNDSLRDATYGGRYLGTQIFDTPGASVLTPVTGTRFIVAEVQAGGGAGGSGVGPNNAAQAAMSQGGTGGTYARGRYTTGFAGATVTVGAGGAIAAAGNNAGGAGGTSSLGALLSCPGGAGGAGGPAVAAPSVGGGGNYSGAATGTVINSKVGSPGRFATAISGAVGFGAVGGDSVLGNGGQPSPGANGTSANGYGGGGSGVFVPGNFTLGLQGGAGRQGIVLVHQFS